MVMVSVPVICEHERTRVDRPASRLAVEAQGIPLDTAVRWLGMLPDVVQGVRQGREAAGSAG